MHLLYVLWNSFFLVLLLQLMAFAQAGRDSTGVLNAGFVCMETVYNSELMAPYDILQHSIYRDSLNYINCFIVTPEGRPFTTSEGINITPHYAFSTAPAIDILIIPSSENSMGSDLQDEAYITWLRTVAWRARWVITLCDGAFPLAATGLLDGRSATTFPGDREAFAKQFPAVAVLDKNVVVDGKYITAVGGALGYEPALYLVQRLYSAEHARRTAEGMVIEWDLAKVPHVIIKEK